MDDPIPVLLSSPASVLLLDENKRHPSDHIGLSHPCSPLHTGGYKLFLKLIIRDIAIEYISLLGKFMC